MKVLRSVVVISAIALVLAGCAPVGPDFVKLEPDAPAEWSQPVEQGIETTPSVLVQWWLVFNDPVLNQLVEVARKNNNTLEIVRAGLH